MSRTATLIGNVSPSVRTGKRAIDIVAALAPVSGDKPAPTTTPQGESAGMGALKMLPGLAGAAAGALFVPSHRMLGALSGHALASTALPIYKGGAERRRALCQLGVEAAGVVGALASKKHPILGWGAGIVAGGVLSALVPGSPASDAWRKWRTKK